MTAYPLRDLIGPHEHLVRRLGACQESIRAERANGRVGSAYWSHLIDDRSRLRVELRECHRRIEALACDDS